MNEIVALHEFYSKTCSLARVLSHNNKFKRNIHCILHVTNHLQTLRILIRSVRKRVPRTTKQDRENVGLFSRNHMHYLIIV